MRTEPRGPDFGGKAEDKARLPGRRGELGPAALPLARGGDKLPPDIGISPPAFALPQPPGAGGFAEPPPQDVNAARAAPMLRYSTERSIAKEVERARAVRVGGCANTPGPVRGSHSKFHTSRPSPFAFTLPYTAPKRKGGDLFETRQEANQEAEDPARTSGPLAGELARREAEAERGARHPPQAHGHDPGRPSPGTVTPTHRKEGTAA